MIRETLGDEAIIVATGEDRARGGVRVTAAIEPSFEIGNDGVAGVQSWLQYDDEQDSDAVAEELTEVMLRHCVPENVMDNIISCATVMGFDDIGTALSYTLEQLYSFRPLPVTAHKKPIMMIGPPGSGKTLAVAKMAARGAMNGLNINAISTDTVRAGGVEQLQAFTKLLQIDLKKAKNPQDLRNITEELMQHSDQVIIDTSGLNPFDTSDVKILAKLIGAIDARPVLVLPAGIDADEAGEMARVFATIGATEILPTRVDIARRLGSLLAAAHQGGLSFSDVSTTPKVAQGLSHMSPKSLANLLVPRLYQSEKNVILPTATSRTGDRKTGTTQ
ncbi:MAG: AAA family ATPase [Alphaproteobacteria bacterium]